MSPARRIRRKFRSAMAGARATPRQVDNTAVDGLRLPPAPQLEQLAWFPPR